MKGVYSLSSVNFKGDSYSICDGELLLAITSALYWKKINGSTKLYVDRKAFDFLESKGVLSVWDEVDVEVLEKLDKFIDRHSFWALTKLEVIKEEVAPFAHVDMDLLFYKKLDDFIFDYDLVYAHKETKNMVNKYVDISEYNLPASFDKNRFSFFEAGNAGLLYFKNQEAVELFTSETINFARDFSLRGNNSNNDLMMFVEQQMTFKIFKEHNKKVGFLINFDDNSSKKVAWNFVNNNLLFYHAWSFKKKIRSERKSKAKKEFFFQLITFFLKHFSDKVFLLDNLDEVQYYLSKL